jgi:membrane-anchored glycerophosphoryl diester phosphodiesterase (GDPDase)
MICVMICLYTLFWLLVLSPFICLLLPVVLVFRFVCPKLIDKWLEETERLY